MSFFSHPPCCRSPRRSRCDLPIAVMLDAVRSDARGDLPMHCNRLVSGCGHLLSNQSPGADGRMFPSTHRLGRSLGDAPPRGLHPNWRKTACRVTAAGGLYEAYFCTSCAATVQYLPWSLFLFFTFLFFSFHSCPSFLLFGAASCSFRCLARTSWRHKLIPHSRWHPPNSGQSAVLRPIQSHCSKGAVS